MKGILKVVKIVGYFILSILGLLLLYLFISLILSSIRINEVTDGKPEMDIFILTNGVHTDIVVPVKTDCLDWSKEVKFENTIGKDSTFNYLAIGWGDKAFYMEAAEWADIKVSTALKATFGLSQSAIHTTYYSYMEEGDDCYRIRISKDQYQQLIQYIQKSFARDKDNHIICIQTDAVYGSSDNFYEANGHYSLIKTCNTWANDALKSCEQTACLWTPFQWGIFRLYR